VLPEQLHGAGLPDIRGGGHLAWRRPCRQPPRPAIRPGPRRAAGLTAIARCANVSVKLSALDFRARWHHWRPADIRPYLETACQLFNPSRLTIGSNWQVCLLSSSYQDSIGAVMDYASSLSASEQTDLRSGTAQRCCRI